MKAKKLLGGILLAVTVIMSSSCEEILNQMSTVPAFYIPEVMYNGQTYQITRFAVCKYEFSSDSKYLTIKENEDGKFIATVSGEWTKKSSGNSVMVNVTAVNPDDSSVEPQVVQTQLHDWEISVFEGESEVKPDGLKAGCIYTMKMYDSQTEKPIEMIYGSYNDRDNAQRLDWVYDKDKIEAVEIDATSLKFKTLKSGDCSVTVSLGGYKRTIEFTVL